MKELGFKNNALVQAIAIVDRTESVKKINKTDWKQIVTREFIVYKQVLLPSEKRTVMMQILNPGFDSKISVYHSIGSHKTGGIGLPRLLGVNIGLFSNIKLTGGLLRAYWVSKDGDKVTKIRRGNYNKKRFVTIQLYS